MGDYERTTVTQSVDEPAETQASTTTRREPAAAPIVTGQHRTVVRERAGSSPSAWTILSRLVSVLFGILQVGLLLRIVLLLLGAEQGNVIVRGILDSTAPFVDPFRGMFRLDQLASSGSVLDVAAVTALIGWTLVEALVLAVLRIGDHRTMVEA